MKVRGSLKRICLSCKMVRRGKRVFVVCAADPKHKQRQGFATLVAPPAAGADPCASCGCGCAAHPHDVAAALPRARAPPAELG